MTHSILVTLALVVFATTAPPKRHTVVMARFQFEPAVIEASIGDTIVWENRDLVPHTARAVDGSWDSADIPSGARRSTVVRDRGVQKFTCLYHSNMKGKLVVR